MPTYTCEFCKKEFNQKIDFTRHQNKKAPCITLTEMQQISQTKEVKTEFKTNLSTIFNYCLDILRNNEHLTGDKALRTLAHLLDLRLLESQIGNKIDIDTYEYDFSSYEDDVIEPNKQRLLSIVRFTNLLNENEDDIPNLMKHAWDIILSEHPTTKHIFLKGGGFGIQKKGTYKKIIDKLNSIDLSQTDYDVLGNAYEEVSKKLAEGGRGFGQFFTQPLVKKFMVNLINPQIHPDGKIDTCCDPAMGTGGFLITYLQTILKQAKAKNIKPDWDFIKTQGLGGREAEPDTYQLAISNMLISSGHMFNVLEKGDSIRNPITNKYDIILANPPFGIDGLTYNEILHPLRNEYMPIKSNSAVPLFLQAIIYMLKVNGRCAVVLPNGKELFKKENELVAVREYLMKTCDLKEIYYLPPVFTHTTISTCVFNFVKKRECLDVLETKIKISKTQKETAREYNFTKTHQTNKVKFYNYNPENEMKHLLIEVPIEKISKNGYSLNYADYLDDTTETNYEDNIVVKTLEEICSIDYGTRIVRGNNVEGEYPVFGSGRQMFSTETFNREGFNVLIGRFALSLECVRIVNQKLFLNDSGLSVKPKTDIVLHKYIAYYLFENQNIIYDCARGTAQKNLDMNKFKKLKIPIPSIEQQKEIIKQIDALNDENKKLEEQIKENIRKSKQIISGMVVKSTIDTEPFNKVQNEIASVEEEIIVIEPKPKVKKIVKKVKKPLLL
jgi:type I restriction-modification system DNA methylase subunit